MQGVIKGFVLGGFLLVLCASLLLYVPFGTDSLGKWWFGLDSNRALLRFTYASMLVGFVALLYLLGFAVLSAQGDFAVELVIRLSTLLLQEALWAPLVYHGFVRKVYGWAAFFLLVSISINVMLVLIEVVNVDSLGGGHSHGRALRPRDAHGHARLGFLSN